MNYSALHIKNKLNNMVFLNIISFCVLSGCGNCSIPNHEERSVIKGLTNTTNFQHKPYNIFLTNSLYKKATPKYASQIIDSYDFEGFKWISKGIKKDIKADIMANSIISSCNLIERLLMFDLQIDNPDLIIYILHRNAIRQAYFIKKHLKIGNSYYNVTDVGDFKDNKLHFTVSSDKPDFKSQFTVLHGFAALAQLCNLNLNNLHDNLCLYIEELELLPYVCENLLNSIDKISTKELAIIGLQLIGIYKKTSIYSVILRRALDSISAELSSRTSTIGEINRDKDSIELCSLSTTANCLNYLSQLVYMFSTPQAFMVSNAIYHKLDSMWNSKHNIFIINDSNKQRFTIKHIASILSALFSYYRIANNPQTNDNVIKQLSDFYQFSIEESCIINKQDCAILQQNKIELCMLTEDKKLWAPIFNKSFEYKLSKNKYYCASNAFKADYVLNACANILNSINI